MRRWILLLLTVATMVSSIIPAFCDPIPSSPALYQVSASIGNSEISQNDFANTIQVSIGGPLPIPGSSSNGLAQAIAGPNQLGVYASTSGTGYPDAVAEATASLTDSLYITGAPAKGYLALYLDINGSSLFIDQNGGTAIADVMIASDGACLADFDPLGGSSCGQRFYEGSNVLNSPFNNNGNNIIGLNLYITAEDGCFAPGPLESCFAQSEFYDTVQIASIIVEDANGNPVPDATVTSLSGVDYSLPITVAPEPSTFVLLGTGLIGIVGGTQRRIMA